MKVDATRESFALVSEQYGSKAARAALFCIVWGAASAGVAAIGALAYASYAYVFRPLAAYIPAFPTGSVGNLIISFGLTTFFTTTMAWVIARAVGRKMKATESSFAAAVATTQTNVKVLTERLDGLATAVGELQNERQSHEGQLSSIRIAVRELVEHADGTKKTTEETIKIIDDAVDLLASNVTTLMGRLDSLQDIAAGKGSVNDALKVLADRVVRVEPIPEHVRSGLNEDEAKANLDRYLTLQFLSSPSVVSAAEELGLVPRKAKRTPVAEIHQRLDRMKPMG